MVRSQGGNGPSFLVKLKNFHGSKIACCLPGCGQFFYPAFPSLISNFRALF